MAKRDYYDVLGVKKGDDEKTIKKAYRKVAMQYHPDKNPGDKVAEEKFKEAAEAYEVLSDPNKKDRYDRLGHAGVDPNNRFGGGGRNANMEDIFSNFGDIFGNGGGNPFESFFGGAGGQQSRRSQGERGSNLRIKVALTFEEIATGVTKKIKVKKQKPCGTCKGSGAKNSSSISTCSTCKGSGHIRQIRQTFLGQMQTTAACTSCNGTGKRITEKCSPCRGEGIVYDAEQIELEIPAGVSDGMQLQMRGNGNAGKRGGSPGDLIINIEEKPHEFFTRDGKNIIYDLFISYPDAALGTSIEIPTLDGKVKIKIPAATQSGKILRLKGKGFPPIQEYGTGDLLIHVNIWTPKELTKQERDLLEKMKNMENFKPTPSRNEKGFFDRMKEMFQ